MQVLAFQSQLVGNVDLAIPGRLFVRQASLIKLSRDGPTTYAAHLLYQLTSLVVCIRVYPVANVHSINEITEVYER